MTSVLIDDNYTCDGSEDLIRCSGSGTIYIQLAENATKDLVIVKMAESQVDAHILPPNGKTLDGDSNQQLLTNRLTIMPADESGNYWFSNFD